MIVDASVVLSALFPDEAQPQAQAVIRDHVLGEITLIAPTLFAYEITNAIWQAVRRQRITLSQAEEILATTEGLAITQEPIAWQPILPLAAQFNRSAYDAAYLALAKTRNEPLITGDLRLYNAVKSELPWVRWVGDYEAHPEA